MTKSSAMMSWCVCFCGLSHLAFARGAMTGAKILAYKHKRGGSYACCGVNGLQGFGVIAQNGVFKVKI